MPSTHQPYPPEYWRRMMELAHAGRSIHELAREFESSANAIRKWVEQTALDEGLLSDGFDHGRAQRAQSPAAGESDIA